MMTIADKLRDLREKKGLMQKELCKETGIGKSTYSGYERGCTPGLYNAIAIADYYGITLDELVGRNICRR